MPAGAKGRQLYVNGVRAERTRGMLGETFVKTTDGYTAPDDSLASFGNLTDVEVVSLVHWKAYRCPIESAADTAITIAEPCFEGIRFEYATWLSPSTSVGYTSVQAGDHLQGGSWEHQRATPGNIELAYAENVSFKGCAFRHLGATALVFGGGSKDNRVEASVFDDISGGALRIGDIQPNAGTSGNTVRNCYITRTGREYFDSVAQCRRFRTGVVRTPDGTWRPLPATTLSRATFSRAEPSTSALVARLLASIPLWSRYWFRHPAH